MYQTSYNRPVIKNQYVPVNNDTRYGFLGPFVLGGITGGLLAPSFYPPKPYPVPYPVPMIPPYPPYPPYKSFTNVVY